MPQDFFGDIGNFLNFNANPFLGGFAATLAAGVGILATGFWAAGSSRHLSPQVTLHPAFRRLGSVVLRVANLEDRKAPLVCRNILPFLSGI